MEAKILYNYQHFPEQEMDTVEDAVKGSPHRYVDTVRQEKNVGGEKVFFGLILYEADNDAE